MPRLRTTLLRAAVLTAASAEIAVVCVGDSNTVGKRAASGHDYPAQLARLLGSGYSVYAKGVGGRTMHSKADQPYDEEEEYDDAREIVGDATTAIVVSIFGTNDAKAENWNGIKGDWVAEYTKFVDTFEALGATVIVGIPVPYLGNDVLLGNYVDYWAELEECPINREMPEMIREVASSKGLGLVDTQAAFVDAYNAASVDDWMTFWNTGQYADRVHPLDHGLGLIAAAVHAAVLEVGAGYVPTYAPTYAPTYTQHPSAATPPPSQVPAPFPTPATPAPFALVEELDKDCPILSALEEVFCPLTMLELDIGNCQTPGLRPGDLCEGDGECGTNPELDNCDDADMYIVRDAAPYIPSTAPTLARLDDACPVLRVMKSNECQGWTMAQLDIDNCATPGLTTGDACEGDGECGTDPNLNNCQAGDMYVVVTPFAGGVDVSTTHASSTRKLTAGAEQSQLCEHFYDNYDRLHVAWAHFIEGRLASDCDVEQGVTAISCADVSLTFTVLSSSCADAVALINADLQSQDEDEVARAFVNTTDVSEEVRDAFLMFLDLYPLVGMDAHTVTKKKEGLTTTERVEKLAKRYWWAIVLLGLSTGLFCKLYVVYHCRHFHMKKKYRQLKIKHRHLEWQQGRLTLVDDEAGAPAEALIDRGADASVAKQGWAAIRHAVKGTRPQKLVGVVRESSRVEVRDSSHDAENPVRGEHHVSLALTLAKREHAAHLLKIADLEDELRASQLGPVDGQSDRSVSPFSEAVAAHSPRAPAPPTPPPPERPAPGSPPTPDVLLE